MNRKIIWGIPIGMVIVGLLIVLISYVQPSYPATVLSVGNKTYTPARNRGRSRSSAVYREELEVSYGDGQTTMVCKVQKLNLKSGYSSQNQKMFLVSLSQNQEIVYHNQGRNTSSKEMS